MDKNKKECLKMVIEMDSEQYNMRMIVVSKQGYGKKEKEMDSEKKH